MNKILRFSFMALLALVSGNIFADDVTVTFIPAETKPSASATEVSKDGITLTVSAGTMNRDDNYRTNKGQTLTVKSTVGNIKKITFTSTVEDPTANYGAAYTVSTGTFTANGKNGTWEGDAATVELTATDHQVRATEYVVTYTPGENSGNNDKQSGTVEKPYTVAEVQALLATMDANVKSSTLYAKGKISKIDNVDTGYGNATFYISDNGQEEGQLEVYRAKFLENKSFTAADQIKVGDEVVISGQVVNYRNSKAAETDPVTPEFTSGCFIYSLNGKTKNESEPQAEETKTVTIAEFNAAAESTSVWYQLTGKVKNLKDGDLYGNFDLEDATGSVYVYGVLSEKGGAKKQFQELVAAKGIQEGSEITIIGNRGSYNGKIEVTNAYFVSISTTTGISGTKADSSAATVVYNLAGQRVDANFKGVVIKNGKKMIQK